MNKHIKKQKQKKNTSPIFPTRISDIFARYFLHFRTHCPVSFT